MVSDNAKAKSDTKKTPEGLCVHSFETLMEDLATFCLNEVALPGDSEHRFRRCARTDAPAEKSV